MRILDQNKKKWLFIAEMQVAIAFQAKWRKEIMNSPIFAFFFHQHMNLKHFSSQISGFLLISCKVLSNNFNNLIDFILSI